MRLWLIALATALILSGCGHTDRRKMTAIPPPPHHSNSVTAHVINSGTGACQLIECAGKNLPILYDCGTVNLPKEVSKKRIARQVKEILAPYDNKVRLVISHPHRDHVTLLDKVLGDTNVVSVHYGGQRGKLPKWVRSLAAMKRADGTIIKMPWEPDDTKFPYGKPFDALACGSGPTHVLSANVDIKEEPNDPNRHSLTLLIDNGPGNLLLLGGDGIGATQRRMELTLKEIGAPSVISAVVAPHHGSESEHSNDEEWAQTVNPSAVIYSGGQYHGHPRCVSTNNYDSLEEAHPHPFYCGNGGFLWFRSMVPGQNEGECRDSIGSPCTNRAEYVTELSGNVTLSFDDKGMSIHCEYESDCGLVRNWRLKALSASK